MEPISSGQKKQGASCVERLEWIAAIARNKALPASACRVAVAISGYFNNARGGVAWPTQERLASDLSASVDTVRRAVNALVVAGHLVVEGGGRKGQAMTYRLAHQPSKNARYSEEKPSNSAAENLAVLPFTTSQGCNPNSLTELNYRNSSISISANADASEGRGDLFSEESRPKSHSGQIIPTKRARKSSGQDSSEEIDIAFSEFWAAYPRKVAKAAAAKAFASAIKGGADADVLIRGAKRYAAERMAVPDEAERERFTAHPATWLSAGRWADEATAPAGGIVIDGTTGEAIHQPPPRPQQGYGPRPHVDAFAFGDRYGAEFDAAMGG